MGQGPLTGLRVVEMAGIGPGPFCAMMLADHGADVLRVERPGQSWPLPIGPRVDPLNRGRAVVTLDLRTDADRNALFRLTDRADALIEGFRPGVMEKLGFGPEALLARNPRLVYGRMTGWGQDGPLARTAGHDLNYAGLTGAIAAIGPADRPPPPPLNLVADFGGGAMMLAFGMLAALLEARSSGRGQVVDAAMVDGTSLLMTMFHGLRAVGGWSERRDDNLLDGGAPFYACYETADGGHLSVCPLEPPFFAALLDRLGLAGDPDFQAQYDRGTWSRMRERLAAIFRSRTRDAWAVQFAGSDACVAPVLTIAEAPFHPQAHDRGGFVERGGILQPQAAPRLSRTPATAGGPPREIGRDDALAAWDA